jgi:hypothetical protein
MAAATDTPSFPDMTCKGSGSGTCTANGYCYYTCTPGNAPFFDFGPINETLVATNNLPTPVKPRQPQGTFVQTTGSVLPKGHCIVSCGRTHLHYAACPPSNASRAWLNPHWPIGMALAGAAILWLQQSRDMRGWQSCPRTRKTPC